MKVIKVCFLTVCSLLMLSCENRNTPHDQGVTTPNSDTNPGEKDSFAEIRFDYNRTAVIEELFCYKPKWNSIKNFARRAYKNSKLLRLW